MENIYLILNLCLCKTKIVVAFFLVLHHSLKKFIAYSLPLKEHYHFAVVSVGKKVNGHGFDRSKSLRSWH